MADSPARAPAAGKSAHPAAVLLRACLGEAGRSRAAFAAHVHLSHLKLGAGLAAAGRCARPTLRRLTARPDVNLIDLDPGDSLVVCGEDSVEHVEGALAKVRGLLTPHLLPPATPGHEGEGLVTWFDLSLPSDHQALTALVADTGACHPVPRRRPPTPTDIARLCATLREAPLADLIRQQVALWVKGLRLWTTLFRETYVSISALERRYLPDVDLMAHPSLFRFVTETLDRRVLAALAAGGALTGREPISLNLNLASLTTPEFAHFQRLHDDLPRPILELQLADILGDPEGFVASRARLQGQGHSVLVDGVTLRDLEYIDLAPLAADFVKLIWRESVDPGMGVERAGRLKQAIERLGRERVVLARVESEEALRWGLAAGVTCLQGRFIDKLVTAMVRKGLVAGDAP